MKRFFGLRQISYISSQASQKNTGTLSSVQSARRVNHFFVGIVLSPPQVEVNAAITLLRSEGPRGTVGLWSFREPATELPRNRVQSGNFGREAAV